MSRRKSAINIAASACGSAVGALSAFITVPYLLLQLGPDRYGIWALIAATTGYLLILDFGITTSCGRMIAERRAKRDVEGVNTIASTAMCMFAAMAILVCFATAAIGEVFFALFSVPHEMNADVQHALWVVGAGISLYFLTGTFQCILWGYERFDVQNLADIPIVAARTVATLMVINAQSTFTELAWLALVTTGGQATLYAIAAWRVERGLRIGWRYARWSTVREIVRVGIDFAILSMLRSVIGQIGPVVIGNRLNNRSVASFAVARQLVFYTNALVASISSVATARATILHHEDQHTEQERLFLIGGKYALTLSILCVGGFLLFGSPFIHLWQGGRQDDALRPLIILIIGEAAAMSQMVTYGIVLSKGKVRHLAVLALLEALGVLTLTTLVSRHYGLDGICIVIAGHAFLFRGILQMAIGCRTMKIKISEYMITVILPIFIPASMVLAISYVAVRVVTIGGWIELIAAVCVFVLIYVCVMAPTLLGWRCTWRMFHGKLMQPSMTSSE